MQETSDSKLLEKKTAPDLEKEYERAKVRNFVLKKFK
jgi:hypothetical protein